MGKFDKIDELKKLFDLYRPLPKAALKSLQSAIAVDMTYNSNAIEGNTLTLSETKVVVEDGIAIGGKTVREHLEALNHYEAIEYVESIVDDAEVGEDTIKNIHYLIMKGIDKEAAGSYRIANVIISGSEHVPPNHIQVPAEMEKLISWYDEAKMYLHPVELAVQFHFKLVYNHPFRDGNGRTARLLMNLILMQFGYLLVIVKVSERVKYINALEKASTTGNVGDLLKLIIEYVEESFKKCFFIAGIEIHNSE
ncbi:Fic family protein [Paenibacillus anaericanus]|uniref:Fic family protein n=1 Tax=Paenibacillus anaericanus TaxID=170367 RepID=A0A3S1BJV3_9BACL|nr:Fic family protein [Paenibacillus anaericanus]RUT43269.1 Fic family protein [Paenibacillus anaericanus]